MKIRYLLRFLFLSTFGTMALWGFSGSLWWVGVAVAAMFFGRAALPLFQLIAASTHQPLEAYLRRGVRGMVIGYMVAGCVIGVGALSVGRFVGFLVAYGAFSFAWVW